MNNWLAWATNFPVYNGLDIPGYSCPSTALPKWRERDGVEVLIPTYFGIAGVSVGAAPVDANADGMIDGTNITIAGRTSINGVHSSVTAKSNGVLGYLTNVNFKDMRDGSSNTMMIGEQSQFGADDTDIRAGWDWGAWMDCANCWGGAHRTAEVRSIRLISRHFTQIGKLGPRQVVQATPMLEAVAKGLGILHSTLHTRVVCRLLWLTDL